MKKQPKNRPPEPPEPAPIPRDRRGNEIIGVRSYRPARNFAFAFLAAGALAGGFFYFYRLKGNFFYILLAVALILLGLTLYNLCQTKIVLTVDATTLYVHKFFKVLAIDFQDLKDPVVAEIRGEGSKHEYAKLTLKLKDGRSFPLPNIANPEKVKLAISARTDER